MKIDLNDPRVDRVVLEWWAVFVCLIVGAVCFYAGQKYNDYRRQQIIEQATEAMATGWQCSVLRAFQRDLPETDPKIVKCRAAGFWK